jgi:PAS domain S-box-containing protein
MTTEEWHHQIEAFQQQVETLRSAISYPTRWSTALKDAVEAMQISLEELQVAGEERQQQLVAIAEAQQATALVSQRYQALFDLAPDGYLVTDESGVIQEINRAAAALLAMRQEHAVGKPLVLFVVPEERGAFRTQLVELRATLRRRDWPVRLEPRKGRLFDAELSVVTVPQLQGQCPSLLWHLRDITERKAAEAVLRQAQEDLEQRVQERTTALAAANAEIRRFAYVVSHDLRAPLINVRGFAKELRDASTALTEVLSAIVPHLEGPQAAVVTQTLDDDIPEALGFIETAVMRMDRLIEAVLQLSRLGQQELYLEPVDTAQLVQDTLRTLAHQLTARQVQVSVGPLPVVQADALALSQIFGNLLANAVAYLDPSRPGTLAITATQHSEKTVFTVQDNGRGIATADIPHIFEPFRRVGRQDVAGEGMGLTYVQMLVRRQGGDITCTSTLGEGTTFTFSLAQARPD